MADDLGGIDGIPDVMARYAPATGGTSGGSSLVDAAINAGSEWNSSAKVDKDFEWSEANMWGLSDMMEGQAYYEKDSSATKDLMRFVKGVNNGVRGYHNRADLESHNYFAADDAGARVIENISEQIV
jgi:hypothetical protein